MTDVRSGGSGGGRTSHLRAWPRGRARRVEVPVCAPGPGRRCCPRPASLVALAAWWLIARLELVHPAALPPPGDVLTAFVDKPAQMLEHTWDTTLEILAGFALSAAAGVLIGLVPGQLPHGRADVHAAAGRGERRAEDHAGAAAGGGARLGPEADPDHGVPALLLPDRALHRDRADHHAGRPGRAGALLERLPLAGVPQGAASRPRCRRSSSGSRWPCRWPRSAR